MAGLSGCIRRWHLGAGLLFLSISACTGDPADPGPDPDPVLPTSCAEEGITHSGAVSGTWEALEGPHHLTDTVYVADATLTIEGGALVCGVEGAAIVLGRGGTLVATDPSDTTSIRFTATDSLRPWGGITAPDYAGTTVSLRNVIIEHAERGVRVESATIESAVLRRILGPGLDLATQDDADATVRGTLIEDVCLEGGGAAIEQGSYTSLLLEDVTIRNAGCGGIYVARRSSLRISGVRIEGSAGVGLEFSGAAGGDPVLDQVEDLQIIGGADRPARLTGGAAAVLLATVPATRLTGNAIDRIAVIGGMFGDYQVTSLLGLELEPRGVADHELSATGVLTLDAGSHLVLRGYLSVEPGQLVALGTASEPVRIDGPDGEWQSLRFAGTETDTTHLGHVHFENVAITAVEAHALRLSDVTVKGGWIELRSPGSAIARGVIEDAARATVDVTFAALTMGAPGLRAEATTIRGSMGHGIRITASDARVEGCSVTGGARAGVFVADEGGSAVVRGCDLVGNAGAGVHNTTAASVDAESNWWGDAAGPEGENGDGVVGDVDFDPWLDAPAAGGPAG